MDFKLRTLSIISASIIGLAGCSDDGLKDGAGINGGSDPELAFIEEMLSYNRSAEDLLEEGDDMLDREELRDVADGIEELHEAEEDSLNEFWEALTSDDPPEGTDLDQVEVEEDDSKPYDQRWLETVTEFLREGRDRADSVVDSDAPPRLRDFAETMAQERRIGIDSLESWYEQWYGDSSGEGENVE